MNDSIYIKYPEKARLQRQKAYQWLPEMRGGNRGLREIWGDMEVLVVNNLPANAADIRDMGSFLGSGRSSGGGHRNPLQYSCLENAMDRGDWWSTIHRVTNSWTVLKQLSTKLLQYCPTL